MLNLTQNHSKSIFKKKENQASEYWLKVDAKLNLNTFHRFLFRRGVDKTLFYQGGGQGVRVGKCGMSLSIIPASHLNMEYDLNAHRPV